MRRGAFPVTRDAHRHPRVPSVASRASRRYTTVRLLPLILCETFTIPNTRAFALLTAGLRQSASAPTLPWTSPSMRRPSLNFRLPATHATATRCGRPAGNRHSKEPGSAYSACFSLSSWCVLPDQLFLRRALGPDHAASRVRHCLCGFVLRSQQKTRTSPPALLGAKAMASGCARSCRER